MSTKGKRYSKEEKQKVVDFVNQYNADHNGRGGVANATKEFSITAMTIKSWMDKSVKAGVTIPRKGGKANIYQQLADLQNIIEDKETELTSLKRRFDNLKSKSDL